jgi:hypothetical protein
MRFDKPFPSLQSVGVDELLSMSGVAFKVGEISSFEAESFIIYVISDHAVVYMAVSLLRNGRVLERARNTFSSLMNF